MNKPLRFLLAFWASSFAGAALASQAELVPPTSGIFTGVEFSQKLGDAFRALASCQKGSSAPANVGGAAEDGLCWIDDSGSPWVYKVYVNGNWATLFALDPSDSSYAGVIGGGVQATIAAGSTVDLGSVRQANVLISGAASISSFGGSSPAGVIKVIRFDAASTLVNSNSLQVPGGFNLTTASGDRAVVTHFGSGNWEVTSYTRQSGVAIDVAALGKTEFTSSAAVPSLHLAADGSAISRTTYPAYLAAVTRAQNGTRTSGNATIASVGNTEGFGIGMPVEGTGIGSSCTVASFVPNTSITLNSSSCVTSSGTSPITVFLTGYGSGGSSSTVGLPPCQGRFLAGLDPSSTNLSNAAAMQSTQGSKTQTLNTGNLPPYTPSGSVSASTSFVSLVTDGATIATPSTGVLPSLPRPWTTGVPSISASFSGSPQGGTSTPFSIVPPALALRCITRVIP